MRYGSVCSGIEAATAAWHSLEWKPVWFSEIDPFPCKVLKHNYPEVPNLGDMTKLNQHEIYNNEPIELLVGGTPCQSFSIAGLRGGMDDERGNLALEYCRILIAKQPRWFVWENVPGVFSSNSGKDFACLLSAFTGKEINPEGLGNTGIVEGNGEGYSIAWRVLDAQYFGVPQRRRRVFVVGHLGNDWRPPYAVLFERDSLRRDFEAGAKERKRTAGKVERNIDCTEFGITGSVSKKWAKGTGGPSGDEHYNLIAQTIDCRNDKVNKEICHSLANGQHVPLLTVYENHGQDSRITELSVCPSVTKKWGTGGNNVPLTEVNSAIARRLTPLECERLQGFPDQYTNIPGAKDSPRYASIGNSMAVPVMNWIGSRIDKVDKILKQLKPKS